MKHRPEMTEKPQPNAFRQGRTTRTQCPPAARHQKMEPDLRDGPAVCVRHRHDVAGLRRVVTVELVVGPVARRRGLGCCRFQGHLVKVEAGTGGAVREQDGNSAGSSSLRQ